MKDVERPKGMTDGAWLSFKLNHDCMEENQQENRVTSLGLRRWMTANIIGLAIVAASACGFIYKAVTWAGALDATMRTQTQTLATLAVDDQKIQGLAIAQAQQGAKIDDINQALQGKNAR